MFRPGTRFAGNTPVWRFDIDVWAWVLVLAALLATYINSDLLRTLGQDSFQYLSVARNVLEGRFGYTSLLHFDAERSFGVVPAPMVTFPPGYPLAMALVSLAGPSLATAGLLISAISTFACVPLLAWISEELRLSRLLRNVVIAGFVGNATVIKMGSSVWSDAVFTFLVLLGVVFLTVAQRPTNKGTVSGWVAAGAAFGMAYAVRYAGLFFIVGLALVVIRHLLVSNRELGKRYAISVAVAGAFALMGITRNIALVGNWRGGNDKIVSNPLSSMLLETVRGANRLLLGPGSGTAGGTFVPRVALAAPGRRGNGMAGSGLHAAAHGESGNCANGWADLGRWNGHSVAGGGVRWLPVLRGA